MTNNSYKASIHWEELDILRGLAAILMIVNHAGYKLLAPNQIDGSIAATLLFIGSFAPVLFFFVTGVGYGVQSRKKKASHWYAIFNKTIILFLADLLMHWSEGRWLGLDFLGFIGLSSLVLEFLRKSKSPLTYAIAGFAAISLMRYLLGPYIHTLGYDRQTWAGLGWIFGTSSTPGVSYPLSPWMAYPFAGYIVGVAAMYYRSFIEKHRSLVVSSLLVLAVLPAVAGLILSQRGASFFRWGTVGLGFYIVSFTVILSGLAYSLAACITPKLKVYRNALSLKGIASLAVVPVHYFILALVAISAKGVSLFSFCIITIVVLTVSFLLAHSLEFMSQKVRQIKQQNLVWLGLTMVFLLAAVVMLTLSKESAFLIALTRTFDQIILCFLFVVRPQFSGGEFRQAVK